MKINPAEIDLILLSDSVLVDLFRCADRDGSIPLQNFLTHHALDNQKKKLSSTWIIVKKSDPEIPLGYFSLACASIDVNDLDAVDLKGCPIFERFPALLIGKFAVDDRYQNTGLGTLLMDYVYAITIRLSGITGCRYLIVESKPTSTWFYEEKCNFIRVRELDGGNVLFYKNVLTLTES
ncbi:MAG: GNAT family N-acetyltransferase [Methanoregula sp.]|jgi:GNAT superfamily N-acetyltransferase|nr:GNAT family N-acetyltransferase [Methanoregula sp.]